MNTSGGAQYALECVLARMTEDELARVLSSLPTQAYEHIRLTAADFPGWSDNTRKDGAA